MKSQPKKTSWMLLLLSWIERCWLSEAQTTTRNRNWTCLSCFLSCFMKDFHRICGNWKSCFYSIAFISFFFLLLISQQALMFAKITSTKMMLLRSSLSQKIQIVIVLGVIHQVSRKNKMKLKYFVNPIPYSSHFFLWFFSFLILKLKKEKKIL